jgi:hypothetical protein
VTGAARSLGPLLAAILLASCQPSEVAVRAAFVGGALAFVAADRGDPNPALCWREAIVVDDRARPAWRFTAPRTGRCAGLFPLFYGRAPAGAETAVPAEPIEPGRLYLFIGDAVAEAHGAFTITRAGSIRSIDDVDPDSPAAADLRRRWLLESRRGG